MSRINSWNHWPKHIQLLLILVTVVVIGCVRFHGISLEGDPAAYAKLAMWKSRGLAPWAEWTFTTRKGLITPTSFILSITGPQLWAFVIWPWTCLLLLSLLVWWKFKGLLQFYVLVLLLLCPWPSAYGLQLFPDFPMMTFCMLALILLPHLRPGKAHQYDWAWGIGLTISLVIAGTCKLTVLYLLPAVAGLAIYDLVRRRHIAFWTAALLTAVSVWGVHFLLEGLDPGIIPRINQLEADHNSSPFSYSWEDPGRMLRRLLFEPFTAFLGNPGVGILVFPALAGIFSGHKYVKPLLAMLIYLLAIHWFGTTSLAKYSPIPADPRMWILLSGPLLILAAIGLISPKKTLHTAEIWMWVAMMVLFAVGGWFARLPGVAITLAAGMIFLPAHQVRTWVGTGFCGLLLLWLGYNMLNKDRQYYQQQEIQLLQESLPPSSLLYADTVLTFSAYLYEAAGIDSLVTWPDSLPSTSAAQPQYFLWNGTRVGQSNLYEDRIVTPAYFDDIRSSWELIGEIENFDIRLYKIPRLDS